ncbi:MAG TPA: SDR family NAD(P)-dependent oxidoreductase [Acidimicrobiales bacterium]|nr:SDR family NAD(P)-dependent oxidoreductase [Acidimicrobiales bacterium]
MPGGPARVPAGRLAGHAALVTGGGRGIGRAVAARLAAEGARVAILDIDPEGTGGGAAAGAGEPGPGDVAAPALTADVADPAAVSTAVAAAADALGGLSILVNNAGVGMAKPLDRYGDDEWARLVGVNLTGVWHGIRAAVPHLRAWATAAGRAASIVNVAGTAASRPTRGEGPYAAAKAGVVALTRTAALEYAPAVRVNAVSPGYIATRLTRAVVDDAALRARVEGRIPLGRIGTVDDVAGVVAFLCSDDAAYVTGHDLVVDGGSVLPSHQSDELLRALLASWS